MSGKMSPALVVGIVVAVVLATVGAYFLYSYLGDDGDDGTANKVPTASFTVSPEVIHAGDLVSFDASASADADGTIASYGWNLGDSTVSTEMTFTHAYLDAGNYTVRLTVVDDDGSENIATRIVEVLPMPVEDGFTVDAALTDWTTRTVFADGSADGDGIDLDEYSLHRGTAKLFFFASSAADLPDDAEPLALLVLLDTDGNAGTGYSVRGMGADYLLEARVQGGAPGGVDVKRHTGDKLSAQGFADIGDGSMAAASRVVEGSVPLTAIGSPLASSIKAIFLFQHDGGEDVGDHVVSPGKGALSVSLQTTATNPAPLGEQDILRMTLRATGAPVSVTSVALKVTISHPQIMPVCGIREGTSFLASGSYQVTEDYLFAFPAPLSIAEGGVRTLDINATFSDPMNTLGGQPWGLYLASAGGVVSDATVCLATPTTEVFYLFDVPASPSLDGCRGDAGFPSLTDADDAVGTDVVEFLASDSGDVVTWGLRAKEMLRGVTLPTAYLAGSDSYDMTGADTIVLYFDMDGSSATGLSVSGIGADLSVTISGKGGVVLSATESVWSGGSWGTATDTYLKLNGGYMEGGFQYLGAIGSPKAVFAVTGWQGGQDVPTGTLTI